MSAERPDARVLIYSHDSFGLGHLRRCRTIAHALVNAYPELSVLILSGSPIIGSFEFGARVDFVRIPGVIKLSDGDYTPLGLALDIDRTIALREAIIRQTADSFDPDIFIVDKEPLGLRGEVAETLKMLAARGTKCVLGLRDILDEPALLAPEWDRKHVLPALETLYDEIWVYGLPQIYETLGGIDLSDSVRRKIVYTGYLRASVPQRGGGAALPFGDDRPYLLVTAGGGGDGEGLFDWVLNAYEADRSLPYPALLVLGPFMQAETQERFLDRAGALFDVVAITFDTHLELLMSRAAGVVAMGGYNTFCEILSFDKPALLIPRTRPRREQYLRAVRAQELGLASFLPDDGARDGRVMATALRQLTQQGHPSDVVIPGLLDGLDNTSRLVGRGLEQPGRKALAIVGEVS